MHSNLLNVSDNLIDLNARLIGLMGCKGVEVMGVLYPKFIRDNLEHVVFLCDGRVVCDCASKNSVLISSWHYALSTFAVKFIDYAIVNGVLVLSFETIQD